MSYDDELRAHSAHLDIGLRNPGVIDGFKVAEQDVPDPFTAPLFADVEATHQGVICRVASLSRATGYGYHSIDSMVRAEATGRSAEELHIALSVVEERLLAGIPLDAGEDDGTIGLSGRELDDPEEEADRLAAEHADILGLVVSAAERRALAAKGQAIGPEGDFPIPDRGHLQSAAARFKQGKLAGHPRKAVRAHILKNARRLGVEVDLGDDGDGDGDAVGATAVGLTQETQAARIASGGRDNADSVIARHPELAHLFRTGR